MNNEVYAPPKHIQFPETEMGYHDEVVLYFPELFMDKEGVDAHSKNYERKSCLNVTFQVTDACNLACFPSGTKILMADFTYKNIEDVVVGDEVMSYGYTKTSVKYTANREASVRKITVANGKSVITTDEHPFAGEQGQ